MIKKLDELIALSKLKNKKTLSVAVAQDKEVLEAVSKAVSINIIKAILVGNKEKIMEICDTENIDIAGMSIIDIKDIKEAAAVATKLVTDGKADFLMKGMIGTSDLLKAVLNKEANLRGEGLLSHVMVYEVKSYSKLLFLTDGGMVPYPDINEKVQILKNAVKVAHSIGIEMPKVAPLCAIETVNPSMQATIDAATLTQMNRRGQINGCIVDGPLALDIAISPEAARHKGIISDVAGDCDILLVPNIESGNFLGKALTYFAGAESAGVIVGTKCPVVLVSRADSAKSKLYSIALGSLL